MAPVSALGDGGSSSEWRRVRAAVLAAEPLCRTCGEPATTADHIVPRKHGGDDRPDNLQPLCAPCNLAKGDGLVAEPSRDW
ncbi:hypothetical protein SSPIM334S_02383 [Streptomyces spiroverticillatus]